MASVDQVQKLFNSAPAAEPPAEYSIDEFDYKYLESCSDLNHLKLLLGVLKSGREGSFPDLEEAFETKISSLDPSFLTSKSMEAAHQDQERIISEINDWTDKIQSNSFKPQLISKTDTIEPIIHVKKQAPSKSNTKKSYREWDLFDCDAELIEKESVESSGLNPISDNLRDIPTSIKKSTVSSLNPEYLANAEKDKGNECLRSKDYEEAIIYYTRSIDLLQRAALYTNRALAYLKMNNFEKAEYDTTYALVKCHDITPQLKIKALVRRATARMKRAKYQGALEDCDIGISLSGDSDKSTLKEFTDLKSEITKKMNNLDVPTPQEVPKKSLRFKIEEVDEIDEEIILPSKPVSSRPLIEEILVENSESVVEEIQAETVASAFSSKPLIEEIIVPESTVEEIQVETSESVEDNQVDEINEVPTIPSKTIKEIQIENELSLLSKIDFKNSNIVEMEEYTVETINPTTTYRPTDSIIDSDDESEQEEPDFFECNVEENEIEIDYFEDTLEIENELDVSEYKNQPGYYEYTMEIIEDDDFSIQDDDDLVSAFEKSFNYNSGFEIKVEKFLTSEPNVLVEVLGATENLDMIAAIIRIILHVFENDREMIFHVRHVMRGISKSNEELQRKIDSVANAEFNALVELSL